MGYVSVVFSRARRDVGGRVRRGEGDADEFVSVVHVGAPIDEGGMAPEHIATACVFNRGQQLSAADFLVALRTELREDEFTLVVPHPVTARLFDDEDLAEE